MSIVSITQAALLVNKSRKTVYKHIQQGRLSIVTSVDGSRGIDTSELIRVYGVLSIQQETPIVTATSKQIYTKSNSKKETPVTINNQTFIDLEKELALTKLKIEQQEKELSYKQQIIDAKDIALSSKQETIDSLKTALKLLEYKQDNSGATIPEKENNASEPQKNGVSVDINTSTGLLGRLKKLFS